jgi:thiamine-phosphate diphosphorylase
VSGCAAPRFVVILDRAGASLPVGVVARAALAGGADVVQIREKHASSQEVETLARCVIEAADDPLRVAVNGHPSIATRLGCHLHLPEAMRDWAPSAQLAKGTCLSRSIHSPVRNEVADYLILGNVFETASKPGAAGLGLTRLAEIASKAKMPIMAIGGIVPDLVGATLAAGAHGVAVRSYVIGSEDPEGAAGRIREQLDGWQP